MHVNDFGIRLGAYFSGSSDKGNPLANYAITIQALDPDSFAVRADGNSYKRVTLAKGLQTVEWFNEAIQNIPALLLKTTQAIYSLPKGSTHWLRKDGGKEKPVSNDLNDMLFSLARKALCPEPEKATSTNN